MSKNGPDGDSGYNSENVPFWVYPPVRFKILDFSGREALGEQDRNPNFESWPAAHPQSNLRYHAALATIMVLFGLGAVLYGNDRGLYQEANQNCRGRSQRIV